MADPSPVTHVSDTARLVAMYRAMETDRRDAIFRDPYAKMLAGPEGERIVDHMIKGRKLAWPIITRTAVMDEIILRAISRDGVDTVLNLAAGLDTRAYRLDLPSSVHWLDVDLPNVLDYKAQHLRHEQPRCAHENVKIDLTDATARRALFERVGHLSSRTLIVTEGLLVYLTPEQVTNLARDLHVPPSFRWWLIDIASPLLMKRLEKNWGKQLKAGNAPLQFAPAENTAFFEPTGWVEVEYRSTWEESRRLNRTVRFAWLWNLIGKTAPKKKRAAFRRMSGIALLGRAGEVKQEPAGAAS